MRIKKTVLHLTLFLLLPFATLLCGEQGDVQDVKITQPESALWQDIMSVNEQLQRVGAVAEQVALLCEQIKQEACSASNELVIAALQEIKTSLHAGHLALEAEVIERLEAWYQQISEGQNVFRCKPDSEKHKTFASLKILNKAKIGCLEVVANTELGGNLVVDGNVTINARTPTGNGLTVTSNGSGSAIQATGTGTIGAPALTLINNPPSTSNDFLLAITNAGVVTRSSLTVGSGGGGGGNFVVNGCQDGPVHIGSHLAEMTFDVGDNGSGGCKERVVIDTAGLVTVHTPDAGVTATVLTLEGGTLNVVDGNVVLPSAAANTAIGTTNGLIKLDPTAATNTNLFNIGTRNFFAGNYPITTPNVSGTDNIAIGTLANAGLTTENLTVAIGSGVSGSGVGAAALATNAIAIGSANGVRHGAEATGVGSVAIGGSDGTKLGAIASALRSVAIGTATTVTRDDAIILGEAGNAAVSVGIGIVSPNANTKLHVVAGSGVAPFMIFDQASTLIGHAPTFLNSSTDGTATNFLALDASNRIVSLASTRKIKENIRDLQSGQSAALYNLRPVIFDPKEGYGDRKDIPGLIAEEVYDVAPNLAALDANKEPINVAWNSVISYAVKELQNHQKMLLEHAALIATQNNIMQEQAALIKKLMQ